MRISDTAEAVTGKARAAGNQARRGTEQLLGGIRSAADVTWRATLRAWINGQEAAAALWLLKPGVALLSIVWCLVILTWVIWRCFGATPPDIPNGTALALASVTALLAVTLGLLTGGNTQAAANRQRPAADAEAPLSGGYGVNVRDLDDDDEAD